MSVTHEDSLHIELHNMMLDITGNQLWCVNGKHLVKLHASYMYPNLELCAILWYEFMSL